MRIGMVLLALVALGRPALAEPGHRGPILGGGGGVTGRGIYGEAAAGFAHRWIAATLWVRALSDSITTESTDDQLAFGVAVRAWSVWGGWTDVGERLYLEGRAGTTRRTVADFEGDLHRHRGALVGLAAGFELLRTARFTIDLRAGGDHARGPELDGTRWWGGLAATFY